MGHDGLRRADRDGYRRFFSGALAVIIGCTIVGRADARNNAFQDDSGPASAAQPAAASSPSVPAAPPAPQAPQAAHVATSKVIVFDPLVVSGLELTVGRTTLVPITLRNGFERLVAVSDVRLISGGAANVRLDTDGCQGRPVHGAGGCLLVIAITPTERGKIKGSIFATHNGPEGIARLDFSGDATDTLKRLAEKPPAANDLIGPDDKVVLSPSSGRAVVLTNAADTPITVTDVKVAPPNERQYRIAGDDCLGRALGPGTRCVVMVSRSDGVSSGADIVVHHSGPTRVLRLSVDATAEEGAGGSGTSGQGSSTASGPWGRQADVGVGSGSLPLPPVPLSSGVAPPAKSSGGGGHGALKGVIVAGLSGDTALLKADGRMSVVSSGGMIEVDGVTWTVRVQSREVLFSSPGHPPHRMRVDVAGPSGQSSTQTGGGAQTQPVQLAPPVPPPPMPANAGSGAGAGAGGMAGRGGGAALAPR